MVVILLGPPGVGKGTQGVLLAEALGWERIATGDLLRAARREGTELGRKAQGFMDSGELVPDQLIVALVRETLERLDPDTGIVFDGYPRTVAQAEALDEVLPDFGRRVDRVVVLEAPDEVLVKRLSGRRSCPACGAVYNVHYDAPAESGRCDRCGAELVQRSDDDPGTVAHRLEVYREQTEPLIRYYERGDPAVERLGGDRPVEAVQAAIRAGLAQSTSTAGADEG